ncbi:MAG: GDP-mannose 4,6-dehydratase, partial [Candidatus Thermoplasmatota archaeon]|nr:GDP-mannose 4,6-dehydratase [Candidatus Thermoplasmatota archaeon]
MLAKGYTVYGLVRRLSTPNIRNIEHILDKITILDGDLADQSSLISALSIAQPDEIYNLAAQSFVQTSFKQPVYTTDVNGLGVVRLLEAMRITCPEARFYQASTSELFGNAKESPQNENTPFCPRSPYGFSKLLGYWATVNYRESYGLHTSNGILFNHESPRRGLEFVTRKITDGVAKIKFGLAKELLLGNLDARRDWGYAPEYVEAQWLMLQQKEPDDYVIATGETHSVREFAELAFEFAGIEKWEKYVKVD